MPSDPTNDDELFDLDDIFSSLPPPSRGKSKAELDAEIRQDENAALAARAFGAWHPQRRVLYVTRSRCQTCHRVYDMPNDRVLTEWQHSDGSRKWANSAKADPSLPTEVDYLEGHALQACHHCMEES